MDSYVPVGEYIICNCGLKIAKRIDWFTYEIAVFHKGQQMKVQTTYDGMNVVGCKKCGFSTILATVKESIGIEEKIESSVA